MWGDWDNDGDPDHYYYHQPHAGFPRYVVRRNDGGGIFTSVQGPTPPGTDNRGACWADFTGDGFLDLYIGAYEAGGYQPDAYLVNQAGTSLALQWTEPAGSKPGRGITACDFDEDGDMDAFVSNYRLEPNYLWRNEGDCFSNVAPALGADGTGGNAHTIGSAWGDLNNDGHFDIFVGNFAHPGQPESQFLESQGPGGGWAFVDRANVANLQYKESYASPALADIDNDGDLDLFMTTVYPGDSAVLYRNDGNWAFTDVTSASGLSGISGDNYQAAWADYNNDGFVDLLTNGRLYRNQGNGNHWLKVRLVGNGTTVNKSAIGAQVRIDIGGGQTATRQVEAGTGEGNQNDLVLHFGLGGISTTVDLDIAWPDGTSQLVAGVSVDQKIAVTNSPAPPPTAMGGLVFEVRATDDTDASDGWDVREPGPVGAYVLDAFSGALGVPSNVVEGSTQFFSAAGNQSAFFHNNDVPPQTLRSFSYEILIRRRGGAFNGELHVGGFSTATVGLNSGSAFRVSSPGSHGRLQADLIGSGGAFSSTRNIVTETIDVGLDEWHHVVYTYKNACPGANNGVLTVYDNGWEVNQYDDLDTSYSTAQDNMEAIPLFGLETAEANRNWNGDIALARIYNTVLPPEAVQSNAFALAGAYGLDTNPPGNLVFEVLASDDTDAADGWDVREPGPLGTYTLTANPGSQGVPAKEIVGDAHFFSAVGNPSAFFYTNDVPARTLEDFSYEVLLRRRGPAFSGELHVGGFSTEVLSLSSGSGFRLTSPGSHGRLQADLIGSGGALSTHRNIVTDTVDVGLGEWHHLVYTYANSESVAAGNGVLTVYDNGVVTNVYILDTTYGATADNMAEIPLFGLVTNEANRNWNGDIALARIYDDVLTLTQVADNYDAIKDDYGLDPGDLVFEMRAEDDSNGADGWDIRVPGPPGTHSMTAVDSMGNGAPLKVTEGGGAHYMSTAGRTGSFFSPDVDVPTVTLRDFTCEIVLRRRGSAGELAIMNWGTGNVTQNSGSKFALVIPGPAAGGEVMVDMIASGGAEGNRATIPATADIGSNEWHHLAYVYEDGSSIGDSNSVLTVYDNGDVANTYTTDTFYAASPDTMEDIQAFIISTLENERNFLGDIGLIRIYRQPLSATEVEMNFGAVAADYGIATNFLLLHVDAAMDASETAGQPSDGWDLLPAGSFELEARQAGNGAPVKMSEGSATFFSAALNKQSARFFMDGTNTDSDGKVAAPAQNVDDLTLEMLLRRRGNSYFAENSIAGIRNAADTTSISVFANVSDGQVSIWTRGSLVPDDREMMNNVVDIGLNEWHHLVFAFRNSATAGSDDGELKVYDNGVLVNTVSNLDTFMNAGVGITERVGVFNQTEAEANRNFNGDIAMLRLYKGVLSPGDVYVSFLEHALDFGLVERPLITGAHAAPAGGGFVIHWTGDTNESYAVQRTTNLVSDAFSNIATGIQGIDPLNTYTDAVIFINTAPGYRVEQE